MPGSRLAYDSWRLAATSSNSSSRRPALPKLELPLTCLGTEDIALSCFPVQDLVKKMLDKTEAPAVIPQKWRALVLFLPAALARALRTNREARE